MLPGLLLLKKEFRQNIILYILPFPFVFTWIFLRLITGSPVPEWATTVFGLVLPFTLAVAYGLQAFDVEEDAQTRDFLLAKPLSIGRIIGEKLGIGLGILIVWTLLLLWGTSRSLYWPSVFIVESWNPLMVVLGTIIVYSASFFMGLLVSGPKKLLAATFAGLLGILWGALIFFNFNTFSLLNTELAYLPFLQETLFYLSGLMVVFLFVGLQLNLSAWVLMQRPQLKEIPRLSHYLLGAFLLLIFAFGLNFSIHPPIRSANLVGAELLGVEDSFWTIDGAWQPNGPSLLLAGTDNRLALARIGETPRIIYKGKKTPNQPIKDVSWSPNGKMISFVEKGQVYVMNANSNHPVWIGKGFGPSWSNSSDSVMFCQENTAPRSQESQRGKITFHTLDFFKANLKKKSVESCFTLQSFNNSWTWDSTRDILLFLDPFGRFTFYHKDRTDFILLPSFDTSKEGIFWNRFYKVPGADRFILVAFVFRFEEQSRGFQKYTARFYDFNYKTMQIRFISETPRQGASNLIFNPSDGTCLWGQGSTYVKTSIPLPKEDKT